MKTISKSQAQAIIENTKGKFFGVTFVKKDGTLRTMNAQYKKQVPKLGYIVLRDTNAKTKTKYRNVNLQTIKMLKVNSEELKVK